MKKKLLIMPFFITILLPIFVGEATSAIVFSDYDDCIRQSGGYADIDTVERFVCRDNWRSTSSMNVCALWVGPLENSLTTTITVPFEDVDTGLTNIATWGMCTRNSGISNTAIDVEYRNTNGSVTGPTEIARSGVWASPDSTTIQVDLEKFREGLTGVPTGTGSTRYERTITISRCHWGRGRFSSSPSCDDQDTTIVLDIPNPTLKAKSNVSNSASDYATTGIVSGGSIAEASTSTANVQLDAVSGRSNPVTIAFSHNPYSSTDVYDVEWDVVREFSRSGYTVSSSEVGSPLSGTIELSVEEDGYYMPPVSQRPYVNGSKNYLHRDQYTLVFNAEGTYTFCESLSLKGRSMTTKTTFTKVCTSVTVGRSDTPPPSDGCDAWRSETNYDLSWASGGSGEGWTNVLSKVKNNSLTSRSSSAAYANWQDNLTYAEPKDQISWKNCYYPGVQKLAGLELTYRHGAHGWGVSSSTNENYSATDSHFGSWYNGYNVSSITTSTNSFVGSRPASESPAIGNSSIKLSSNDYQISSRDDVGQAWEEKITSDSIPVYLSANNLGHESWRYASYCCGRYCARTCYLYGSHTNNRVTYSRNNGTIHLPDSYTEQTGTDASRRSSLYRDDNAILKVPYNFINTATIAVSSSTVYAGDTINIRTSNVTVNTRYNGVTIDTYATQVDQARVKLFAFTATTDRTGDAEQRVSASYESASSLKGLLSAKQLVQADEWSGNGASGYYRYTLNRDNTKEGVTTNVGFNHNYSVFDASAGDYMCFVITVFPSTSGIDTQMNASGDRQLYVSSPACRQIHKKPNFQIFGGSLFSTNNVEANYSQKYNVGLTTYDPRLSGATYFGSQVEESILTSGYTKRVASGAGIGQSGTTDNNYCNSWVPLSIANYSASYLSSFLCPSTTQTGKADVSSKTLDRAALVDYWAPADGSTEPAVFADNIYLSTATGSEVTSATGRTVRWIKRDGSLNITGAATIASGQTYVVKATENITINTNIYYSSAPLSSSGEIPKVVIYAGGDIDIACSVTELDAIIMAEGNVNTCSTAGGTNSISRSNQLTVRGMIISNSLALNRTYGNSVGSYSETYAEAVNYDTSAILWGRFMSGSAESSTLVTTYQTELAPRY